MTSSTTKNFSQQPRYEYILLWTVILTALDFLVHSISGSLGLVITITFFTFIILVLITSRWFLNDLYIGHRNIFWQNRYPLDKIKKIYAAKIPTNQSSLQTASKFGEVVAAASQATGRQMPVLSGEQIESLAQSMAPMQIWLDLEKDGQIQSLPLVELNKRIVGLKKLFQILQKLSTQRPELVDKEIFKLFF